MRGFIAIMIHGNVPLNSNGTVTDIKYYKKNYTACKFDFYTRP